MVIFSQLNTFWQRAQARRRQVSQVVRELEACSDRELAELGLARGDILAVAHGTFRRS